MSYVLGVLCGVGATVGMWAVMEGLRRWHEGEPVHLPTTTADRAFLDDAGIDW